MRAAPARAEGLQVPIGAVIVHNDRVVAEAHNATEETVRA
jgi:tRNA(Arg) A34 adenosine deaminase TadA